MNILSVPGDLDALEDVSEYIAIAAGSAGLNAKSSYKLRLAVDEIVTNIITHGYAPGEGGGSIHLYTVLDEHKLCVRVEDYAPAFDPNQALAPDLTLSVEERPVGGLGLFLVRQSVDEFVYERVGNRNRNILVVNRAYQADNPV